tara:strand:+ start:124 stop:804 length:681 start_codon:yes stop_codon:yes gene_type:complete
MFSIVIPLFNESDNIKSLIEEIDYYFPKNIKYEVILINDASTDNTEKVINSIKNENLLIVNNEKNKGQSFSIHKGIIVSSYDIIITIDGDGQNDPADIPKIIECYTSSSDLELVGGIRKKRKDNIIKIVSSKIANYVRSRLLNDNCEDTGCSLKIFNKKIFLKFPYFDGMHRFLPALFVGYGYKTMYIKVNHRRRKFGISKYGTMNRLFKGIRDIIKVKKILKQKY